MQSIEANTAIVVIGRNEGERLKICLHSLAAAARTIVYVDSGSVDGSPSFARSTGCHVIELDPSRPMSAARARNEGFAHALTIVPDTQFVQFLDGDCELDQGWLVSGLTALAARTDVGLVCGHIRELHSEATIYNTLAGLEWQKDPGEILSSGGNFLTRTDVFRKAGGFCTDVIAAEDDEFCLRVRKLGFTILQLDADMVRHDIAMSHFSEWWRRSRRTGHAFAQVAALHGSSEDRYFALDVRRILVWGLLLPLLALALAPFTYGLSILILLSIYALQFGRTYLRGRKRGWTVREAIIFSSFTAIFKFPALLGLLQYHARRWRGSSYKIIEYKRSA